MDPAAQPDTSVSIVMPTFNAARTLDRAIASVLAQTHTAWDLICIDDASQDCTRDRLEAWAAKLGSRMTILHLAENGGPARARNRGLAVCRGTWIAVLDSDDAWRPDRLRALLDCALQTRADVVCDNLIGFDDHTERETAPLFAWLPECLDVETVVAAEYQGFYNLGYLKPLVRRDFLAAHRIRYDEDVRTGEDLMFLLLCVAQGAHSRCLNRPGYVYTTPVGNSSGRPSRSSSTMPNDASLSAALEGFASRFRARLRHPAVAAVRARIAYLDAIAPIADFRHARLHRDWIAALRLFMAEPQVRRRIWTTLRPGARPSSARSFKV